MKPSSFTGSPCEESRCPLQDLDVLFEAPVLTPELGELGLLATRQALAPPGVDVGLAHPFAHRGLGQVEVPCHLADRTIAALAQLDDLGLELRRERAPRSRRLSFLHGLHDGQPPGGVPPDRRCPSDRANPSRDAEMVGRASLGQGERGRRQELAVTPMDQMTWARTCFISLRPLLSRSLGATARFGTHTQARKAALES